MEDAYIDFARTSVNVKHDKVSFMNDCMLHVSSRVCNKNKEMMKFGVLSQLFPKMRIFPGDIIMTNNMISVDNIFQAFQWVMRQGCTPEEVGLLKESDGSTNFGLSFDGLKRCAQQSEPIKDMLLHVSWICTSYELYQSHTKQDTSATK